MRPDIRCGAILVAGLAVGCGSNGDSSPNAGPVDASSEPSIDGASDGTTDTSSPHDASGGDAPGDAGPANRANGTLWDWQTLTAMPLPRANHCSVTIGSWLVVIGGNYAGDGGFVSTDTVHVAPIQPDGTLGAWSQAGATPSPVFECTAVSGGTTLYVVDGIYDDPSKGAQVWSADLSAQGKLATWKSLGPLPGQERALYSNAWIQNGTLYAMDANLTGDVMVMLRAPLGTSGLGAWSQDAWLPGFRGHPQYALTGSFVYVLGGYVSDDAGNLPVAIDVNGAPIKPGGAVGAAFATTALPTPVAFGTVAAVDDYLFLVGGKDAAFTGSGQTQTASAQVAAGGQLAPWAQQAPLPEGRTNHAMAVGGDYVFVTGGGSQGPGLDTVFSARVRF